MASIEADLRFFEAGVANLEAYLLSNELYWPLNLANHPGEPPFPRLTLGNLLLARTSLAGRWNPLEQQARLGKLMTDFELQRSRWRVAWGNKAARSFRSRLNMWRDYLEEYRRTPEAHADRYRYQVRLRVILRLLAPEAEGLETAELELLDGLDALLRVVLQPGSFTWENNLQAAFPVEVDWYLYGTLPIKLQK
jgi:hypothetical protein